MSQQAQQLIDQLVAYQKKVVGDRETALAALERAGLVTKDGQPTGPTEQKVKRQKCHKV